VTQRLGIIPTTAPSATSPTPAASAVITSITQGGAGSGCGDNHRGASDGDGKSDQVASLDAPGGGRRIDLSFLAARYERPGYDATVVASLRPSIGIEPNSRKYMTRGVLPVPTACR
jgi:hypothetical protein